MAYKLNGSQLGTHESSSLTATLIWKLRSYVSICVSRNEL
jgi:hypothetical protein